METLCLCKSRFLFLSHLGTGRSLGPCGSKALWGAGHLSAPTHIAIQCPQRCVWPCVVQGNGMQSYCVSGRIAVVYPMVLLAPTQVEEKMLLAGSAGCVLADRRGSLTTSGGILTHAAFIFRRSILLRALGTRQGCPAHRPAVSPLHPLPRCSWHGTNDVRAALGSSCHLMR